MGSLILKCAAGALVVLIISLLAKSRSFYVAGLVPLFPTFALIAHFIMGTERSVEDLRTTVVFGLWSIVPYATYLLSVYWLSARMGIVPTLLLATLAWLVVAAVLVFAWQRLA